MDQAASDTPTLKEETYSTWTSPSRLFKRRNKEYFTNIGAIVFLLVIILVFAQEYVLVAALLSIAFLIYVLSTVPPEDVSHRITNFGIESAGHFYRWEELAAFWFEEQWGQRILMLQPKLGSRIILLLGEQDQEKVQQDIEKHIPFRQKPERSWVENASSWLSKKIPLEKPQS